MDKLKLRKATADDFELAYRIKKAAFRQYIEKVWGWDEDEQRKLHQRRFDEQNSRIINLAGEDVGFIASVVTPDCLQLNQLFILPAHQGKGIGRQCMLLIMAEARELGLPVRTAARKVNPRAVAFYLSLGFVRTGETDTHVLLEKAL